MCYFVFRLDKVTHFFYRLQIMRFKNACNVFAKKLGKLDYRVLYVGRKPFEIQSVLFSPSIVYKG